MKPLSPRSLACGLVVGLLGLAARLLVQPFLGNDLPFVFAFPATVFAALGWGTPAGLAATAVGALAASFSLLPPYIALQERPLQVGAFVLSAILICLTSGHLGKSRENANLPGGSAHDTPLTSWLRTVLAGTVLIPIAIFVIMAWWGYVKTHREAEASASRASGLILEHAQKTFAIALDVAQRTAAITALPDDDVRAHEREIQQRLADLATGLPSIVNVNVWDAQGRGLARSDMLVVNDATVADRAYFIEQRDHNPGVGITDILNGRQSGKELMNLVIRRTSADGSFRGIVSVSLTPAYFRDYYRALTQDDPRLSSFSLIRTDGLFMARWPPPPDGLDRVPPESPTRKRLAVGEDSGSHVVPAQRGRESRLVSFRRLPGYPLYVVVGFSNEAMFADWSRFLALLAAILVPATAGLFFVSWVALKKTRREQAIAVELRDEIRRRSQAERNVMEAQKWKTLSVLTGGVAHDFNNLLAIVSTSLHVHRRKHPELADDKQIQAMSRAIKSGARLTRQLLSFSRKQALKPETIRLQEWLATTAELVRSTLGPNVTLRFSIAEDTAAITVDPAELELALINLAINSRHALPKGGLITVVTKNIVTQGPHATQPMVLLEVIDNGVGMAPEVLPRVREPFFTTRESGSGSGLGLSQVDGFVGQAGGSLEIESTLGAGTTVRLYFPAVNKPLETPTRIEEQPFASLRGDLLLVEDNEGVAASTRSLLVNCGICVISMTNAPDALKYLAGAEKVPDVVLSDIAMPGNFNGIELALRLKVERPGLPVLLTTGYADQIDLAVEAGLEVLPKPVPPEELLQRLRSILAAGSNTSAAKISS